MDAPLGLRKSVGIFTAKDQSSAFDSRRFARQDIIDFHFPAAGFSPALIHAHEHIGPIARFGSASAGVDADDAVALVVGPVEENLQFEPFKAFEEFAEVAFEFLLELDLAIFG